MSNNSKSTFVVIDECILAVIHPDGVTQVLRASVLRGASTADLHVIATPMGNFRLATRKDFDDYRVVSTGYEADTENYNFPKN